MTKAMQKAAIICGWIFNIKFNLMTGDNKAAHFRSVHLLLLIATTAGAATGASRQEIPSSVFVHDPAHGNVKMGVKSDLCDNGRTNLDHDWDGVSDGSFACTASRRRAFEAAADARSANQLKPDFRLDQRAQPLHHRCMSEPIRYEQRLPTSGPHRPLWPVWGRYQYVPAQRWLHSLEHGGIVGLYHPCAPAEQVEAFADAIAGCLRRHVIGADGVRLRPDKPFALLAFRNKVLMAKFDAVTVRDFILSFALRGPEQTAKEGQYSVGLLSKAEIVSDFEDRKLCPSGLSRSLP